jgi:hypothetical protein
MPEVRLDRWNEFLRRIPGAHFLQSGEWGVEVELRLAAREAGGWRKRRANLFRSLPLGLTLGYMGRQPNRFNPRMRTASVRRGCRLSPARSCGKSEPDLCGPRAKHPLRRMCYDRTATAIEISAHSVQPRRTITVDIRPDEGQILRP